MEKKLKIFCLLSGFIAGATLFVSGLYLVHLSSSVVVEVAVTQPVVARVEAYDTKEDLAFLQDLLQDLENMNEKDSLGMSISPSSLVADLRKDIAELKKKEAKP